MKELKCDLHIVGGALTGLLTAYCASFLDYNIIISEKKNIIAPLKKAQNAVELVTDGMNIEDVLKELIYIFRSKIPEEIWPTPNP